MRSHKNLLVWKESIDLIKFVYQITATFPENEKYGIVSQMKRAVISITLNIAEGAARKTKKDFNHFLNISEGSLSEIDAIAEISLELSLISKETYEQIIAKINKVSALLRGLIKSNNRLIT